MSNIRIIITVATCFVMISSYNMDRNVAAGVLPRLKYVFQTNDQLAGLIQTLSICSFLFFAPICGYLGDRYNRNYIMAIGMLIWSIVIILSSLIENGSQHFWLFLLLRACVGIGAASYSSNAPSIFADFFTEDKRSRLLTIFNLGVSVGSGLGYWVGTAVNQATNSWRQAFRIAPCLGAAAAIICALFNINPPRGEADIRRQISRSGHGMIATSLKIDICNIIRTKTFIWITLGFVGQLFSIGVIAFWGPTIIYYTTIATTGTANLSRIGSTFGLILLISGMTGILAGAEIARIAKERGYQRADAMLCAIASGFSAICVFLVPVLVIYNMTATWVFIFMAIVFLCMGWTPVLDIVLYIIVPARRSTAQAIKITIAHLFGDAFGPYIIGVIADSINASKDPIPQSYALRYATMMTAPFISALSCGCFLMASFTVLHDKQAMITKITHSSNIYHDSTPTNHIPGTETEVQYEYNPYNITS